MENQNREANAFLAHAPVGRLMLRFSLPCVLSMLVSALYNIVDQVFIGRSIGYLGNAATNVVFPFTLIALAVSLLIGDGAAAVMSLKLGAGDQRSARRSVGSCITLSILAGLVLMLIGFLGIHPILRLFGVTEACREYALQYMRIILAGIPFYVFTSGVNGVIRADGSPRYAMLSTVLGAIINLILDPVMIFGMNMGMRGAAWATIIGQIATCLASAAYFRRTKAVRLERSDFRPRLRFSFELCKMGISSFITQVAIVIIIGVANNLIHAFGPDSIYGADIPLSAVGIVMKVFAIVVAFSVGIAVGGQPICGYNYGAGNFERVRSTYRLILRANLAVGVLCTLIFELCPQTIVNLFGSESQLYNDYACLCFRVYLGTILFCCIQKASSVFLQSIGCSLKAMLLSLARDVIFFVPGIVLFARAGGVTAMLWAAPVSDTLSLILTAALVLPELRKMRK